MLQRLLQWIKTPPQAIKRLNKKKKVYWDGEPQGADIGHTFWPAELCALQRATQREQHRWFYTCSCPAFSTLVTSTFGSLTTQSRFQFTQRQRACKNISLKSHIFHRLCIYVTNWRCCSRAMWRSSFDRDVLQFEGIFKGGVTFFFSEFSFNRTNGQNNGLWRCVDKRSGPETEPACLELQV